jgi:putative transposase
LTVLRSIDRNPVRAGLVESGLGWPWSSAAPSRGGEPLLHAGLVPRPPAWLEHVNEPQTNAELEALRDCIHRWRPYGDWTGMERAAHHLGLEASLRSRRRPRKRTADPASLLHERSGQEQFTLSPYLVPYLVPLIWFPLPKL